MKNKILCNILNGDCEKILRTNFSKKIHLTFFDPPFNQGKAYRSNKDNMSEDDYWDWLTRICKLVYQKTCLQQVQLKH